MPNGEPGEADSASMQLRVQMLAQLLVARIRSHGQASVDLIIASPSELLEFATTSLSVSRAEAQDVVAAFGFALSQWALPFAPRATEQVIDVRTRAERAGAPSPLRRRHGGVRQDRRVPIELPVEFDFVDRSAPHLTGVTIDLSDGGAALRLDPTEPLAYRERGLLVVQWPDEKVVALDVVVAHPQPDNDGVGLQFVKLRPRTHEGLRQVLAAAGGTWS